MWVAEWNGQIVGMVGLIQNEDHKPGIAELQRMSVSKTCRKMGVASKLLEELLKHSRQQGLEKIVWKLQMLKDQLSNSIGSLVLSL